MVKADIKKVPELRFPSFSEQWTEDVIDSFVERYAEVVNVDPEAMYREIGVRSHGKGVFHKEPVEGRALGNKRVFSVHRYAFVVNIVFGWEQAVALTSEQESGFIASHRFPMFIPCEEKVDLKFLLLFFLRKRGKHLLGLASPGGAGRNKTLGQKEFSNLNIVLPKIEEQQKIAAFLGSVDAKLNKLRRKRELLETWKRGLMQKLFSQQLRFTQDDGTAFPDWDKKKLDEVAIFTKGKGISKSDIVEDGAIECVRYGELYTYYGETIDEVKSKTSVKSNDLVLSKTNDVIIPASGETRIDIATASCVVKAGIALSGDLNIIRSKMNGVFLSYYFNSYKKYDIARMAQGISVMHLYSSQLQLLKIDIPAMEEQQKIADFLSTVDKKIEAVTHRITQTETFKKGLLQKMFV